jgi:hypothetical protein
MGVLVGGESKLGSTDPVDDGDMTKFQLHSHVQSIMSTTTTTNGLHIGATLAIHIQRVPTGFMD